MSFNPYMAAKYIRDFAVPRYDSSTCGYCARAVRFALSAGGIKLQPVYRDAKELAEALPALGFVDVTSVDENPRVGDICYLEPMKGHPHGHICMYTTAGWCSDFVQKDRFGSGAFRERGTYTQLRYYEDKEEFLQN